MNHLKSHCYKLGLNLTVGAIYRFLTLTLVYFHLGNYTVGCVHAHKSLLLAFKLIVEDLKLINWSLIMYDTGYKQLKLMKVINGQL